MPLNNPFAYLDPNSPYYLGNQPAFGQPPGALPGMPAMTPGFNPNAPHPMGGGMGLPGMPPMMPGVNLPGAAPPPIAGGQGGGFMNSPIMGLLQSPGIQQALSVLLAKGIGARNPGQAAGIAQNVQQQQQQLQESQFRQLMAQQAGGREQDFLDLSRQRAASEAEERKARGVRDERRLTLEEQRAKKDELITNLGIEEKLYDKMVRGWIENPRLRFENNPQYASMDPVMMEAGRAEARALKKDRTLTKKEKELAVTLRLLQIQNEKFQTVSPGSTVLERGEGGVKPVFTAPDPVADARVRNLNADTAAMGQAGVERRALTLPARRPISCLSPVQPISSSRFSATM